MHIPGSSDVSQPPGMQRLPSHRILPRQLGESAGWDALPPVARETSALASLGTGTDLGRSISRSSTKHPVCAVCARHIALTPMLCSEIFVDINHTKRAAPPATIQSSTVHLLQIPRTAHGLFITWFCLL